MAQPPRAATSADLSSGLHNGTRWKAAGPTIIGVCAELSDVPAVPFEVLTQAPSGESSAQIRTRVLTAQVWRHERDQARPNAQLGSRELKTHCELTPERRWACSGPETK